MSTPPLPFFSSFASLGTFIETWISGATSWRSFTTQSASLILIEAAAGSVGLAALSAALALAPSAPFLPQAVRDRARTKQVASRVMEPHLPRDVPARARAAALSRAIGGSDDTRMASALGPGALQRDGGSTVRSRARAGPRARHAARGDGRRDRVSDLPDHRQGGRAVATVHRRHPRRESRDPAHHRAGDRRARRPDRWPAHAAARPRDPDRRDGALHAPRRDRRMLARGSLNFALAFATGGMVLTTLALIVDSRHLVVFGRDAQGSSGLLMSILSIVDAACTPFLGRLGDHQRAHAKVAAASLAVVAIGLLAIGFGAGTLTIAGGVALVGVGTAGLGPSVLVLMGMVVPPDRLGTGAGVLQLCGDLGGMLGPLVGTAQFAGAPELPYALTAVLVCAFIPVARGLRRVERPAS